MYTLEPDHMRNRIYMHAKSDSCLFIVTDLFRTRVRMWRFQWTGGIPDTRIPTTVPTVLALPITKRMVSTNTFQDWTVLWGKQLLLLVWLQYLSTILDCCNKAVNVSVPIRHSFTTFWYSPKIAHLGISGLYKVNGNPFLYNIAIGLRNFNWIRQQKKNFPIDPHCKNWPLSATL